LTLLKAIILGIVQGLTEFLPISSSGHLVLAQSFLNITEPPLFFDVTLHFGTLMAVVMFFRRDIYEIITAIFGRNPNKGRSTSHYKTKGSARLFAWYIIIGTIPTVIIALVLKKTIESAFVNPLLVSIMLIVTGIILWLSGRMGQRGKTLNTLRAIIIGTVQGIAALPGISRSGATISTALIAGIDGEKAARLSLLMSIPAILGATILEFKDIESINISIVAVILGTLVAFVVGYISIKLLVKVLIRGYFSKFAYYCWAIGIFGVLWYVIKDSI
jgi:undecaprenyl-diphosphatase